MIFTLAVLRADVGVCSLNVDLRKMVEVARVELASEIESTKLLRVYCAFDLGWGTPTHGLIPNHPFDSAPCSGRAELPAA